MVLKVLAIWFTIGLAIFLIFDYSNFIKTEEEYLNEKLEMYYVPDSLYTIIFIAVGILGALMASAI